MKIKASIFCCAVFLFPVLLLAQSPAKDSLKVLKADSLMTRLEVEKKSVDSLKDIELKKMNDDVRHLSAKISQLKASGLPVRLYKKKLDSVQQRIKIQKSLTSLKNKLQRREAKLLTRMEQSREQAQKKISIGVNSLEKKIDRQNSSLDSSGLKLENPLNGIGQNTSVPGVPSETIPGMPLKTVVPDASGQISGANPRSFALPNAKLDVPGAKDLTNLTNETKLIQKQGSDEIKKATGEINEMKNLKNEAGEISVAETKAKEIEKEVNEAIHDKEEVKKLEKEAEKKVEQQATQVKELKELKQKNPLEEYKDMLADFKKQTGVREIKDVSIKSLPNPFIGQEEKLKAGVSELNKLKLKYGEVNAHTFPLKKIHNSLKGKPFKDRFTPSLAFQGLSGKLPGLDLMPYFMYRVSGCL